MKRYSLGKNRYNLLIITQKIFFFAKCFPNTKHIKYQFLNANMKIFHKTKTVMKLLTSMSG